MKKSDRATKHRDIGNLVWYLGLEHKGRISDHLLYVNTGGRIDKRRSTDFHPYFPEDDPCAVLNYALNHEEIRMMQKSNAIQIDTEQGTTGTYSSPNPEQREAPDMLQDTTALASNKPKYVQPIPTSIMETTPNPPTRGHALRYPDSDLWGRSFDRELDKIGASGEMTGLKPAKLGLIPKGAKIVPLTITFNYKMAKDGTVEEHKSRSSVRGDQMQPDVYFDPGCTSVPMVDNMAARIVISHSVEYDWQLEHLDVKSAFLHEDYRYGKPLYLREMARADGLYRKQWKY